MLCCPTSLVLSCVSGKCSPRSCDYFHSLERDGIMRGESRWGTCCAQERPLMESMHYKGSRDMHVEALVAQITHFSHMSWRNNNGHIALANVRCSVQDVVPKSEQTKDLRSLSLARKQENRKGRGRSSWPLACIVCGAHASFKNLH